MNKFKSIERTNSKTKIGHFLASRYNSRGLYSNAKIYENTIK